MENIWQDIRYGVRMLLKAPSISIVATIALALGIGANTAIFSVVHAALLRALPYDATRLVAVESLNPQKEKRAWGVSAADFWDWKDRSQTFERLSMYSGGGVGLKETERVEMIPSARVTTNFFETFGVTPALGRTFVNAEGFSSGPRAIILSHRIWQTRYGGDPAIVDSTIKTDAGAVTVVGVMPPEFKYPSYAEVWTPLARDGGEMKLRANRYFQVVGRIKPAETIESAQSELTGVAAQLVEAFPRENEDWTIQVTDWRRSLVRDSRTALLILMGAVGFLLLIACANVANLLLARAATRRKEIAIRLALGASRGTVLRQLLTESLLLGLLGGVLGLLLAVWGVDAMMRLLPTLNFTFQSLSELRDEIRIDRVVMLFALAVSIATSLVFGLVPGWQVSKTDVNESLKEGSRGGGGNQRPRNTLVIAEIALALVLLIGAGLLMNSFVRMLRVDPGYDPKGLIAMALSFPMQNKNAFAQQVMERVAAAPDVASVSLMSFPTLGGLNFPFNRVGNPFPNGDVIAAYSAISPNYFRTLKTPLRDGREFDDRDMPNTPGVAIVNETMARQYFPGEDPIGQQIVISYLNQRLTRQIVGIVGDIKQEEPSKPTRPEIFVPFAQLPWFSGTLLVRSAGPNSLGTRNAAQQAIWSLYPELPESKAEEMEMTLAGRVAEPRLYALLLGIFAAIAVTLAAVGIYGVMSFAVTQRTHEIGLRMALGAQASEVRRMIISSGMVLTVAGVSTGLLGSLAMTRLMRNLLFGVSATDPITYACVVAFIAAIALIACYLPARRASRVDPMVALREE